MIQVAKMIEVFNEGDLFEFVDEKGQEKSGVVLTSNGTLVFHKNFNEEYYHKYISQDIVQEYFDNGLWKLK